MYHAQRHATKIVIVMLLVLGGITAIAIAQPVDFGQGLDAGAIGGAVEGSGLLSSLPAWAAAIIPPLIIAICSVVNAMVSDKKLGKFAPLINRGALAFGKAKTDEQANQ